MEMNVIMEDASSWCIITGCGVSSFTVDTQAILQRPGKWFSYNSINFEMHR